MRGEIKVNKGGKFAKINEKYFGAGPNGFDELLKSKKSILTEGVRINGVLTTCF